MAYKDDTLSPDAEPVERGPRKDGGKMKDDEFRSLIKALVQESEDYIDSDLQDDRVTATDYFHGRALGNEKDGRSKVIITEVRDKVLGIMPDLLALFFGSERAVEFMPTSAGKTDIAEQATEFIRKVTFEIDNPGFQHTHAVLLDGLVRRLGTYKWWWDDTSETKVYSKIGLQQTEIELVGMEDGVEITEIEQSNLGAGLYDIEYKKLNTDGKARFAAVPPEEVIFLRDTRTPDSSLFFGHRMEKTKGELIALGVSEKDIEKHGGSDPDLDHDELNLARNPASTSDGDAPENDEANDKILYIEGYTRIDYDGDGIAELRKVCTIGPGYYPVTNDPVDEVPFSVFTPIPEPHTLVGQSYADLTADIQRIKSAVTRGILDSLSTAIFPRTWFKEQDANLSDVMSTEIGAPIRTRTGQGAVGVFQHAFVGKDAFPVLTYFDEVSEARTGHSKGAEGLDADALQSTTKTGVDAAVTGSRSQTELVARIFAENALKPLFRGLYRLIVKHQPQARMVRLREQWIEVDPRNWDADLDVQVNVALGQAPRDQKMSFLAGIKNTQEQLLTMLGPSNPIVGLGNYRYTLGKLSELAGFPDHTRFFKPLPLDWEPPPPPPQPPSDPAMAMVQVEMQKAQAQAAAKQAELQLKAQSQAQQFEQERIADLQKMQLEREKTMQELAMKERQLRAELEIKVAELALKGDMEAAKLVHKTVTDILGTQAQVATTLATAGAEKKSEEKGEEKKPEPAPDHSKEEIAALKGALQQMQQTIAHLIPGRSSKSESSARKKGGKKRIKFLTDDSNNIVGADVEDMIEQAEENGIL